MSAEALQIEDRFGLISQSPVTDGLGLCLADLINTRRAIELLRPGVLPELNRTTIGIVLFDVLHPSEDRWSRFYPFPRLHRINGEFEDDQDRVLSGLYVDYVYNLNALLRGRPGDVLIVGSRSIMIPDNSRLAIDVYSHSDYFDLVVRKWPVPDVTPPFS